MTGPLNANAFRQQEITRLKQENEDLRNEVNSLRQFVTSLNSLYSVTDNFKDDSELFPFLSTTLSHAMKLLNAPDGSLALLDDETNELVFMIVLGELGEQLTDHRIPATEGIAGWVVRNAKPALVRDVRLDPRFYSAIDDDFTFKTQSIAAAPLIGGRKVYGLIEVLNQPGNNPFSENDLALLNLLCRAAGEALALFDRLQPNASES